MATIKLITPSVFIMLVCMAIFLTPLSGKQVTLTGQIYFENSTQLAGHEMVYISSTPILLYDTVRADSMGNYQKTIELSFDSVETYQLHLTTLSCQQTGSTPVSVPITAETDTLIIDLELCSESVSTCNASFTYTLQGNQLVQFTNTSTGDVIKNIWFYGDGDTSLMKNPTHYYSHGGVYPVTLYIETPNACYDSVSRHIYVPTQANFMAGVVMAGDNPLPSGKVLNFNKTNVGQGYTPQPNTVSYISSGTFYLTLMNNDESVIQVIPEFGLPENYFPEYFPTYSGDQIYWEDATAYQPSLTDSMQINLVSQPNVFYGKGSIAGKIQFIDMARPDVNNIFVFLLDGETNAPLKYDYVKTDTTFSFNNIPDGNYKLLVDKFGIEASALPIDLKRENRNVNVIVPFGHPNINSLFELHRPSFSVYPNPFTHTLHIEVSSQHVYSISAVSIYNSMGLKVRELQLPVSAKKISVNMLSLPPGIYFIQMNDEIQKVIKGTL